MELDTDRLRLRCPREGDGKVIIDAVLSSLPELKPWLPWATDEYDANSAEDWCRRAAAKRLLGEDANYLIFRRDSSRHIGNISSFSKNWRVPKFEIGYWLATRDAGHGFMTEALIAVTAMTLEVFGAKRIEIFTDDRNHRSGRVALRAGYQLESVLHNDARDAAGELEHRRVYAKIA